MKRAVGRVGCSPWTMLINEAQIGQALAAPPPRLGWAVQPLVTLLAGNDVMTSSVAHPQRGAGPKEAGPRGKRRRTNARGLKTERSTRVAQEQNIASVCAKHTASPLRKGLRVRGEHVQPEVRHAVQRFAKWLRVRFDFPKRVPVYLMPSPTLVSQSGKRCSASFWYPDDRRLDPRIRVATGDYAHLKAERGRDNALAAILTSVAHEIIHYQQWCATGRAWEDGTGRRAARLLRRYAETVRCP